eukprot:403351712
MKAYQRQILNSDLITPCIQDSDCNLEQNLSCIKNFCASSPSSQKNLRIIYYYNFGYSGEGTGSLNGWQIAVLVIFIILVICFAIFCGIRRARLREMRERRERMMLDNAVQQNTEYMQRLLETERQNLLAQHQIEQERLENQLRNQNENASSSANAFSTLAMPQVIENEKISHGMPVNSNDVECSTQSQITGDDQSNTHGYKIMQ